MRRDSNDKEWQKVKKEVKLRDSNKCRLLKVLSATEALILIKNAGQYLNTLDPAHYISVSEDSSIMYDKNNIVMLNHYSHSNLDSYRNPLNGKQISKEEVKEWWIRILKGNEDQYKYLIENDILKE